MAFNQKKFLDSAGVSKLWAQVKTNIEAEATRAKAAEAAALKAAQDAQADVDALETYVGTIPEGATATNVVAYVQEKTSGIATNAALAELQGKVSANESAIQVLKGNAETVGSVANTASTVAAAKVAEIVAGANAKFDTLKEIADWIMNDTTGAAGMANDIAALEAKMAGVDETVVKSIANAIEAALKVEGVDKYALASDLTTLAGRVKALEDAGYQNANQVGSAIDAKIAALDLANTYDAKGAAATAEANAKAHANSLAKNYATAAQGALAETAVQKVEVGATNGTIKVDGTEVAVAGLKSAAFTEASDYDVAGSAQGAYEAIIALTPEEVEALLI